MEGPAVHYNIGVSAWQLGRLELAADAFLIVAQQPEMAALAHYNLGLVSLRQDDADAARAWFLRARDGSDDPALQRLAEAQLDRLVPAAVTATSTPSRAAPRVFVAASLGYDDNVALLADGDVLGATDTASALAETSLGLSIPLGRSFSVEAGGFALRHADAAEFDQSGVQAEFVYRPQAGAWRGEMGAGAGVNWLDGETFEERVGLLLGASRGIATDWRLQLGYRLEDIEGSPPFTGLSGQRHEAGLQLDRRIGVQRIRLGYRLELNDRASEALSADRHRLDAEWQRDLDERLRMVLGAKWRYSHTSMQPASRTERRLELAAGVAGPLPGRWEWFLQYDWTRNDATDALLDYRRHRIMAGFQGLF